MTIPKWVKEHAKTIAAFVVTWVGNMVVALVDGTTPFPQNREEWTQYLLTSVGAAVATFLARNKITQKQLDRDDHVLGGIVVEDKVVTSSGQGGTGWVNPNAPQPPASGGYVNPFPDPTV